jgi:predicted P-loop ATPase
MATASNLNPVLQGLPFAAPNTNGSIPSSTTGSIPNGSTASSAAPSSGQPNRNAGTTSGQAAPASTRPGMIGQTGQSGKIMTTLTAFGYTFRMNELIDDIEVNQQLLTDGLMARIRTQMRDADFKDMRAIEDAYIATAFENRFHPIKDYFASLPAWDGHSRIAELSTYIRDSHTMIPDAHGQLHTVFHLWSKRWLIGAVAKIYGSAQNPMLVLDGKQDIGKSSFAKWLTSGIGGKYYSERPLNLSDKDMLVELLSTLVWEVGELGNTMRKADVEALKAFITMNQVTVRPAYARKKLQAPAVASLIGTVNSDGAGFLNDPTGSRRFLCITIERINFDYERDIDINLLWSEALHRYHAGEPWRLAPCEKAAQRTINEDYEVPDPYEALLRKHFIFTGDSNDFLTTNDIREHLESINKLPKNNLKATQMELAKAIKRIGLRKDRSPGSARYRPYVIYGIVPKNP